VPDVVTEVTAGAKRAESWLKQHERILIVFMVLAVGGFLGNRYLNNSAAADRARAEAAVAAATQARTDAATAAQQYQATIDALQKQNASLATAVASRQAVLVQKQQEIQAAPIPLVAAEWQRLIGGATGDIVSSTVGVSVTDDAARKTVIQLEAVPVLQANLADETKIAQNTQTELNSCNNLVGKLNTQIGADDKACKAEIASIKADARKSKRNWFVTGMAAGAGAIAYLALHFHI
jgi:predicted negative regulator of RcsB-dependent stress response